MSQQEQQTLGAVIWRGLGNCLLWLWRKTKQAGGSVKKQAVKKSQAVMDSEFGENYIQPVIDWTEKYKTECLAAFERGSAMVTAIRHTDTVKSTENESLKTQISALQPNGLFNWCAEVLSGQRNSRVLNQKILRAEKAQLPDKQRLTVQIIKTGKNKLSRAQRTGQPFIGVSLRVAALMGEIRANHYYATYVDKVENSLEGDFISAAGQDTTRCLPMPSLVQVLSVA